MGSIGAARTPAMGISDFKIEEKKWNERERKNLENALDSVVRIDGVVASRVHGGGFAGTILVFAKKSASGVEAALTLMFGEGNVFKLAIRPTGAEKLF